jgi:hypothetical protein
LSRKTLPPLAKPKKPPDWEASPIAASLLLQPDLLPTTISSSMLRNSTTTRLIMMMGLFFGLSLIEMGPDSVIRIYAIDCSID